MKVVIFGTGGFAREVLDLLEDCKEQKALAQEELNILGFIDENPSIHGNSIHGKSVLGGLDWLISNKDISIVIAVGDPNTKKKIYESINKIGDFNFPNIIHPSVKIGSEVKLGMGNIICYGSILTTDIEISNFITINLNCTVGHDSSIKDYVTISPGVNVSGNVVIGEGADIGTNSVVIQGKEIGEWSVLGAGAVVVKDVPSRTVSVGNPAKVIKEIANIKL